VIGVNNTSSTIWLVNYRNQRGISFPFIFDDKSKIFNQYEVGGAYGNNPPTYVLVDTKGIVKFRSDNKYKQTDSLAVKIQSLLLQ
jgi:peroxiredoxin